MGHFPARYHPRRVGIDVIEDRVAAKSAVPVAARTATRRRACTNAMKSHLAEDLRIANPRFHHPARDGLYRPIPFLFVTERMRDDILART